MICLGWFILLYKGEKRLGAIGPWEPKEAQARSHALEAEGLQDWDKLA
jgi:hypothetical protein